LLPVIVAASIHLRASTSAKPSAAALTVARKRERLQAERRYCGVSPQKPGHREQPGIGLGQQRGLVECQVAENADNKRAADIDDQRAPGKRFADAPRHEAGHEIARHRT